MIPTGIVSIAGALIIGLGSIILIWWLTSRLKSGKLRSLLRIVLLPVFVLSVGFLSLILARSQASLLPDTTPILVPVETMTTELGTLRQTLNATGSLASLETSALSFARSAPVTEVLVEAGDYVQAGDVLARVDTTSLDEQVRSAELDLRSAQASLTALQAPASDLDMEMAQLSIDSATASLSSASQTGSTANDDDTDAQIDTAAQSDTDTVNEVAQVLSEQTGIPVEELTTALQTATIAELVDANEGDLDAVIEAVAAALDEMTAAGGMQAQMFARLGDDTTEIATQFVNGELAQAQQFLLPLLLTGELPQFGGQGGGRGEGGNFAPPGGESSAPPNGEGFALPGEPSADEPDAPAETPEPTATRTAASEPTEVVARPTRIAFPTAMPAPEVTPMAAQGEDDEPAVSQAEANGQTCTLVIDFNLNVRDQPTADGSVVLTSIPFGNVVTTNERTEDNWYSVTYNGTQGWVTGEYVTAGAGCQSLPVVAGD